MKDIDPILELRVMEIIHKNAKHMSSRSNMQNFTRFIREEFPPDQKPEQQQIIQVIWSLVSRGLIYFDLSNPHSVHWIIRLTDVGTRSIEQDITPDRPDYINRLQKKVPDISETVITYATESVAAYQARCFSASAVMIGVAAEAAFLEMAFACCSWLSGKGGETLKKELENPSNYIRKFQEFRKRLEPEKNRLPPDLKDNMTLRLDAALELLRNYRNDAAHPSGATFDQDDARGLLEIFVSSMQTLYLLKKQFE